MSDELCTALTSDAVVVAPARNFRHRRERNCNGQSRPALSCRCCPSMKPSSAKLHLQRGHMRAGMLAPSGARASACGHTAKMKASLRAWCSARPHLLLRATATGSRATRWRWVEAACREALGNAPQRPPLRGDPTVSSRRICRKRAARAAARVTGGPSLRRRRGRRRKAIQIIKSRLDRLTGVEELLWHQRHSICQAGSGSCPF